MRLQHDQIFAREIPGIDLVLGGHDHDYHFSQEEHKLKEGTSVEKKVVPLVKSGHDFKDMTEIDITFGVAREVAEEVQHEFDTREVDQENASRAKLVYSEADETLYQFDHIKLSDGDWDPEPETASSVDFYFKDFAAMMGQTVGYLSIDLESRNEIIQTSETNFGNYISDLIRTEYLADFAISNAGFFRKNGIISAGEISMLGIQESFPFNNQIMVLKMSGRILKEALEQGVKNYPSTDNGGFLQVSNLKFSFD